MEWNLGVPLKSPPGATLITNFHVSFPNNTSKTSGVVLSNIPYCFANETLSALGSKLFAIPSLPTTNCTHQYSLPYIVVPSPPQLKQPNPGVPLSSLCA